MWVVHCSTLFVVFIALCTLPGGSDALPGNPVGAVDSESNINDSLSVLVADVLNVTDFSPEHGSIEKQQKRSSTEIDKRKLPADCLAIFANLTTTFEEAFRLMKRDICELHKCKIGFTQAFIKFGFIRETVYSLLKILQRNGLEIDKAGIGSALVDRILDDCFLKDPKIIRNKDFCKATSDSFASFKGCALPKVMGQIPQALALAPKACNLALRQNLFE